MKEMKMTMIKNKNTNLTTTQKVHLEEEKEDTTRIMEEEADDDELWNGEAMRTMYSDDLNMEEIYASRPFSPHRDGSEILKRKAW
ncbi:unnamed protein product [Eruca vesicaria subsp. sativa]|uniref:Uncharacterized protein n=1 Tax=Eruca vesicaria subsp. sativa TaxID=29727 RepID=A0ABC8IXG3_ERUVS|nr:unnamed protein product [Eruca vesicaria subsp. sativa]